MAVIDDVPGIKVTVQINGQDVVEYDDPDASELNATRPTSSKYIECIDDAEFAVQHHVTDKYKWGYKDHYLNFKVSADGSPLRGKCFREKDIASGHCIQKTTGQSYTDAETGQLHERKCKFSTISTGMLVVLYQSAVYSPSY